MLVYFIILILELCQGGDLVDLTKRVENSKLSEYECAYIMYQLSYAISYAHKKGVVHRDLKLENVFK